MSSPPTYRTLVAATDFSSLSVSALRAASELSRLLDARELCLVHVRTFVEIFGSARPPLGLPGDLVTRMEREVLAEARDHLDRIELTRTPAHVTREVRIGGAAEQILDVAKGCKADLVVLATHGRSGLGRLFLGSVASSVIRLAGCPIYTVSRHHHASSTFRRVLAAVDLSPASVDVLAHAAAFARASGATLDVLSVVESPLLFDGGPLAPMGALPPLWIDPADHRRALDALISRASVPPEVSVEVHVERGVASGVIMERAAHPDTDLLVIGTSGHNIVERAILGSTATKVVARAEQPVLVIPQMHAAH